MSCSLGIKTAPLMILAQENLFQKPSFLHQLTHNMARDCSLNPPKNTSPEHVVHKNCFFVFVFTFKTMFVHYMFWTFSGDWRNNLLSYCGLIHSRMRASDTDLPVRDAINIFISIFHQLLTFECPNWNSNREWTLFQNTVFQ